MVVPSIILSILGTFPPSITMKNKGPLIFLPSLRKIDGRDKYIKGKREIERLICKYACL